MMALLKTISGNDACICHLIVSSEIHSEFTSSSNHCCWV